MIVITQPNATEEQIQRIVTRVREFGLEAQISRGASRVIIGVLGPEALLREKAIAAMPGVEAIVPVEKPYKLASYEFRGAASPVAFLRALRGCGARDAREGSDWVFDSRRGHVPVAADFQSVAPVAPLLSAEWHRALPCDRGAMARGGGAAQSGVGTILFRPRALGTFHHDCA